MDTSESDWSGATTSSNFPVHAGGFEPSPEGGIGFLVRLSPDGSQALASTYTPFLLAVLAVDSSANAVFSGTLGNFPATPGSQWPCPTLPPAYPAVNNYAGFLGKVDLQVNMYFGERG